MRKREVYFSPEARADLIGVYDFIAASSGSDRALAYIMRIERYCRGLELASERGTRRDDLRPGLRVVGFERRITVAFSVDADRVNVLRILYAGRDLARALTATRSS